MRAQEAQYAGGKERPLRGYAATMMVYGTTVAGLAAGARLTGRTVPDRMRADDILLAAVATHKLGRLIARDPVTSPLRAPFTSYQGTMARPSWTRTRAVREPGRPSASSSPARSARGCGWPPG